MKQLTILSFLLLALFSFAQEPGGNEYKYELNFEEVSQSQIKQVIGTISPLFNSNVKSEGIDFSSIYFISKEVVSKEEITKKLNEKNLDFAFEFKKTEQ